MILNKLVEIKRAEVSRNTATIVSPLLYSNSSLRSSARTSPRRSIRPNPNRTAARKYTPNIWAHGASRTRNYGREDAEILEETPEENLTPHRISPVGTAGTTLDFMRTATSRGPPNKPTRSSLSLRSSSNSNIISSRCNVPSLRRLLRSLRKARQ